MNPLHQIMDLLEVISSLKARIAELEANQKPIEKRKTLGEIAEEAALTQHTSDMWPVVAKAVAEAIIERHLSCSTRLSVSQAENLAAAIRREFEE